MYAEADFQRVQVQFSYVDRELYIFMNTEDYSQYSLGRDILADQLDYRRT